MSQTKTTKSKLPPLDFSEEVEKYEAKSETKEINFGRCSHRDAHIEGNLLVCPCGSSWSGTRLHELLALFKEKK